jgi:hypothetical protein
MKQKELQHLYWRAGFGLIPNALVSINKDREIVVNELFISKRGKTNRP